ncbi:MAG: hypothetical protein HC890_18380 [Chloroflexaceae bacterium]|nr:hypothetical protein [Chloroflexaceae bacterium]
MIEVADGLYQAETAQLVASSVFHALVDGILFASNSALGAVAGANWLQTHRLPIVGISGVVTASPLAARETAQATGLPVLGLNDLYAKAPL